MVEKQCDIVNIFWGRDHVELESPAHCTSTMQDLEVESDEDSS